MTHPQPRSWNLSDIKWRPTDLLGKGANASVYKAIHAPSGMVVAVKVMLEYPEDEDEVKMLEDLNHPNIVKIYKAGSWQNQYLIVMEFCSEGSLSDYLKKKAPNGLNDDHFLALLECLRNSLEYMKQKKIIHRDIKPLNICIHKDEEGKLIYKMIDFGCARPVKEGEKWPSSESYVSGTPMYWHPRINLKSLGQSESVTTGCKDYIDLWAIGVTLFVAATGQKAFQPQPCRTPFQMANKLQRAYELKKEGVICMKEDENTDWEQLDQLPPNVAMSPELVKRVTPVIAGLMEKARNKMLTAEMFMKQCDEIKKLLRGPGEPKRRPQRPEAEYTKDQPVIYEEEEEQTVKSATTYTLLDAERAMNALNTRMMNVGLENDPDYLVVKRYFQQQDLK